eukprot:Selendium_serpulae@DN4731_c0_g1_i1.p1
MAHEPAVGFAADAYARHRGLGVGLVTYGVGGLNMVNSVACGYAEHSPMLIISGGPSTACRKDDPLLHHKVRSFDSQRIIFEEVTCSSAVLLDPTIAIDEIRRVVADIRRFSRPGYIEIPTDIAAAVVDVGHAHHHELGLDHAHVPHNHPGFVVRRLPSRSDLETLHELVACVTEVLNKAKSAVMVIDVEVHRFRLVDLALEGARHLNIPVVTTLLSKAAVEENHPLYRGIYSGGLSTPGTQELVESADCVFIFGAAITDVFLGQYTANLNRKKLVVVTSTKAFVGVKGFPDICLPDFLAHLPKLQVAQLPSLPPPLPRMSRSIAADLGNELSVEYLCQRKDWRHPANASAAAAVSGSEARVIIGEALGEAPVPAPTDLAQRPVAEQTALSAALIFELLDALLPSDSVVVCDTGDALIGSVGLRIERRDGFVACPYYLSLGYAVPATVGVLAANCCRCDDATTSNPSPVVVAVVGDGGFLMTGMELASAALLKCGSSDNSGGRLVVLIINNGGFGTQRHIFDGPFNDVHPCNYAAFASFLGEGRGVQCRTSEQLTQSLRRVFTRSATSGKIEIEIIEAIVPSIHDSSAAMRRLTESLAKQRMEGGESVVVLPGSKGD